jgi:hypothetical protein
VERLLLLWDELDEVVGYGRHLVAQWVGWRGTDPPS